MVFYDLKKEFKKISSSFLKVKEEIRKIQIYIAGLEKNRLKSNEKIKQLEEEIDFLKKVVFALETQNNERNLKNKREIIGNKDSKVFHYSNCPYAKKISQERKILFPTIEDAVKKGYRECKCIVEENQSNFVN